MISHWRAFEEYQSWIGAQPREVHDWVLGLRSCSMLENIERLFELRNRIHRLCDDLVELLEKTHRLEPTRADVHATSKLIKDIVSAGRELLAFNCIVAKGQRALNFISCSVHADDAEKLLNDDKITRQLRSFVSCSRDLVEAFNAFQEESEFFLVQGSDLPDQLLHDFVMARDLFGIGAEEAGVLIAGRGLEGVLREIARLKALQIDSAKGLRPADEADFYDLIELFYRVRWRSDKRPVIDKPAKALLHYIRDLRNSVAHPRSDRDGTNWREQAAIIASKANSLWKHATRPRAGVVTKVIRKDW